MTVFAANRAAWNSLPIGLQQLLRRELPQLEARIWRAAELDTTALFCADKEPLCEGAGRNAPVLEPQAVADAQRRRETFVHSVLPRWLLRCSADCASVWRKTLGRAHGIALPALP